MNPIWFQMIVRDYIDGIEQQRRERRVRVLAELMRDGNDDDDDSGYDGWLSEQDRYTP